MQKTILFLLCSFSVCYLQAQDMERVRQTIDTLCSPIFFGRGYLKNGDQKTAQYLAQEFEQIGLSTFDSSYFQTFHFTVNTFPKTPILKFDGEALRVGYDFIINALSNSGHGFGEIYYLNDSIFLGKNSSYFTQFLGENLTEKILVFDSDSEQKFSEMPHTFFMKIAQAQAHIKLKTKLTASVSRERYPDFYPPIFEVLKSKFSDKIKKITFSVHSELIGKHVSQNVIGYFKGTENPDSMLVISAHYDHLGGLGDTVYFDGANDNASGVSMLLEMAHDYKQNSPKNTIVFMLFAGEEAGLVGSKFYTENPLFPLAQIKFLLNLDLVGTGDEGASVVNASLHPEQFKILAEINENQQLIPKIMLRGRAANSDHYFFSQKGVPTFFVYSLGGIQAYHDVHDQAATLPLTKYKEIYKLLMTFLEKI